MLNPLKTLALEQRRRWELQGVNVGLAFPSLGLQLRKSTGSPGLSVFQFSLHHKDNSQLGQEQIDRKASIPQHDSYGLRLKSEVSQG